MRNVIFIGQAGCAACHALLESAIAPLSEQYPENVSAHLRWDGTVERVSRRKPIAKVPLIVVERDGREEFRYSGRLTLRELRAIIECEREVVTLDDVLDGDFR